MRIIEVEELVKSFGEKRALRGVSFSVRKGHIMGLLGPNGAGKTTTVRILATLLKPDAGTARVAGFDVLEEPTEVRRSIGYLPERPCLYERLTVRDNLAFYGRLYDVPEEELGARIEELLTLLGLGERANDKVGTLSKGLRQRVAIARALLHDPPVLLLDQPTSDLDPASARDIRELVRRLREGGKTVLICTHNLTEAEELCDLVAVINEGRILAVGPPGELMKEARSSYTFEVVSLGPIGPYLACVRSLNGVVGVELSGERRARVSVEHEEVVADVVRELVLAGCRVLEVRIVRPSLEDVYLRLVRGP